MHKNRILIVSDDEKEQDAFNALLASEGYELIFALGRKALEQANITIPDLVLLDPATIEVDGYEICKRFRVDPLLAEVPIIMLIACKDKVGMSRALEAGVSDFINKPLDSVEACTRIRTLAHLSRYHYLVTERSRFQWVVEQSNDGYMLLDAGDIVRYANSNARFYLKIFKDSVLQKGFLARINQLFQKEPPEAWENWPQPNVAQPARYLVRPETDNEQALWLQVDILDFPSEKYGQQLVRLQNVSEHMNLQRQVWSFQSFVSHKLRAPLNGLVSLQMLDKKEMDLSSERAQALLKIARQSARRLQEQILDILQYVDSSILIKTNNSSTFSLQQLPPLITKIKWDLDLDSVMLSIADSVQLKSIAFSEHGLELVLRELLMNAKKFHPQQSPDIDIKIVPSEDEKGILLSVTDNGRHLSEQELSKVWIPYYQSEKAFTGEVKGMGLGLAMVTSLIWSSGGQCRLTNREDQIGIKVELYLPLSTTVKGNDS